MTNFYRIGIICILLVVESQKIFGNTNHGPRVKRSTFADVDVKKVMKVMGKLPGYFKQAAALWETFEQVHDMFAGTPRFKEVTTEARLDALNGKVDKLIADVHTLKENLLENSENKYDRRSVEGKIDIITQSLVKINDDFYSKFLHLTNSTKQAKSIYDWAKNVQSSGTGLQSHLLTISTSLVAGLIDSGNSYNNLLDLLAAPNLVNELMCVRQKSAQQSIHFLYEQILMAEIRSYLMFLVSIEVTNAVDDEDLGVEDHQRGFNERMDKVYNNVKVAMTRASREFWRCDRSFVEGTTYSILPPIFQKYVLHEGETRPNITGYPGISPVEFYGCKKECSTISGLTQKRCTHEMCTHAKSKKCDGVLRDCEFKDPTMTVCSSADSSYRRYEYISTGKGSLFGVKKDCLGKEVTGKNRFIPDAPVWWYCDYCLCTCDSSMNGDVGVSFDLRTVASSLTGNMVITQIKIVTGETIHFEIKEGELLPGGRINSSNTEDVPYVSSYIKNEGSYIPTDYARITWDKRTICLDDLESPDKDRVLTGIKFGLDRYDRVELVVRLTRFNIATGELYPMETKWFAHRDLLNVPKRSSLSMKYLDIPNGKDMNHPRSRPNQCIEFHTSGLDQDAGQTVVPFVDIQSVTLVPPMPLTGAGLFLRGNDDIAGFITPKLFTLNLEPYLPEPKVSGK